MAPLRPAPTRINDAHHQASRWGAHRQHGVTVQDTGDWGLQSGIGIVHMFMAVVSSSPFSPF